MFKEMKLSTKFGLALAPLVVAAFVLLAFVLGADGDSRPSLAWIWIAIAAILGSGGVMYKLANSMTLRLTALSTSAQRMSEEQVPQVVRALADRNGIEPMPSVVPIEDRGTDEIGELAISFNAVQDALVGIATEQMAVLRRGVSEIFVTLARRNRSLVDRQLALLDELEADVEDPKLLTDYYRIDHLATRMRRNAESLLVLARSETRRVRSQPVAIDDVVRAGISEIEDYQRAQPLSIDTAELRGPVVGDLAHLLAELLDNATAFSPPGSVVSISGAIVPGGYALSVEDDGVGLSEDRLVDLNRLLVTPPVIGLSVEPTLGLSVVSLLAEKHGAVVQLRSGTQGGIVADIFLPASLFASGDFPPAVEVNTYVEDADVGQFESIDPSAVRQLPPPSGQPLAVTPPVTSSAIYNEQFVDTAAAPHSSPAASPVVADPEFVAPVDAAAPVAEPTTDVRASEPAPIVEPAIEARPSVAQDAPVLPGRVPGASTPTLDARDTRSVGDEASSTSAWDAAMSNLERTAPLKVAPTPTLVLPTRSRGATIIADEVYAPVSELAADPESLRSKLNAFRTGSSVSVSAVPSIDQSGLPDAPENATSTEGSHS